MCWSVRMCFNLCFSLPYVMTYFLCISLHVKQALYNRNKFRHGGIDRVFGKEQLLYDYTFLCFNGCAAASSSGCGNGSVLSAGRAYFYLCPAFSTSSASPLVI